MGLPQSPVTLSPDQVAALNAQLSETRHEINNKLSLIVAAVELIRRKPDIAARYVETIAQQPDLITVEMKHFSAQFERAFGITREP
ncbi:MAG: hypothetical protein HY300_15560 [Verrucomicrobia bacterium]|nr:hypothetical protein [Verrucomicrobiota bacterium]